MSDPSRVRVTGPLEPFRSGFAVQLSRQGYAPGSVISQLQLAAHLSRWLQAKGLGPDALEPRLVERFLTERRARGYSGWVSTKALEPLLSYLRALGVTPPAAVQPDGPLEEFVFRYRRYLELERSLMPATVENYLCQVKPLLQYLVGPDAALEFERLDAAAVRGFMLAHARRQARGSAKVRANALRVLLRYLRLRGMIDASLAAALPPVPGWRLASLPKGLSAAEVRRLLAACDRRTAKGRRDFAIMTLLVRLGLRCGEVARLSLDDIDWHAAEIVVCGKGERSERLPLPSDVGEALVGYLRRGRPASALGRSVFVRVIAPHRALGASGVSSVVEQTALRAGLGRVGAHRLRHTAACQMLQAGASLPEIGQVLRHRRASSTAIYAKVDMRALRALARPWPGGVA